MKSNTVETLQICINLIVKSMSYAGINVFLLLRCLLIINYMNIKINIKHLNRIETKVDYKLKIRYIKTRMNGKYKYSTEKILWKSFDENLVHLKAEKFVYTVFYILECINHSIERLFRGLKNIFCVYKKYCMIQIIKK